MRKSTRNRFAVQGVYTDQGWRYLVWDRATRSPLYGFGSWRWAMRKAELFVCSTNYRRIQC